MVDDDASVRRALRRLLQAAGFPVVVFSSAAEILELSSFEDAGCLVLDIRMPGISGLDLQSQLAVRQPDLPIIIVTGHANDETQKRAIDAGAIAVLYKPFDDEALLSAIERAMGARRQ